jgi:hypothetical protein
MVPGPIQRGWAEFMDVAVAADLDADVRYALELAYQAGASQALGMVADLIDEGATVATLGSALLAWADEIVERSSRIEAEVFRQEGTNGATGC